MIFFDTIQVHDKLLSLFKRSKGLPRLQSIQAYAGIWWGLYVLLGIANFMDSVNFDAEVVDSALFLVGFLGLFAMQLAIMFYTKEMGKWEQAAYDLWESGEIDDYRNRGVPLDNTAQASWYKEGEEEYTPEMDVFKDQEKDAGD